MSEKGQVRRYGCRTSEKGESPTGSVQGQGGATLGVVSQSGVQTLTSPLSPTAFCDRQRRIDAEVTWWLDGGFAPTDLPCRLPPQLIQFCCGAV